MGSSHEKITAVRSAPFPGGCVEAEEEVEAESEAKVVETHKKPLTRVTVCKTDEKGWWTLSDGREILFSEGTMTHLSKDDWTAWKLNSKPYVEGNWLIRSANLYAFLGPEFDKEDQRQCDADALKLTVPLLDTFKKVFVCMPLVMRPFITDLTSKKMRDLFVERGVSFSFHREQSTGRIQLYTIHSPADEVSYDYGANDEFENLSVTVPGDIFADSLADYVEDMDDASFAGLKSFLSNTGTIEVMYTAEGEYNIQGFDGEIPSEIEAALHSLALSYLNGSFMDESEDSDEPTDQ